MAKSSLTMKILYALRAVDQDHVLGYGTKPDMAVLAGYEVFYALVQECDSQSPGMSPASYSGGNRMVLAGYPVMELGIDPKSWRIVVDTRVGGSLV